MQASLATIHERWADPVGDTQASKRLAADRLGVGLWQVLTALQRAAQAAPHPERPESVVELPDNVPD